MAPTTFFIISWKGVISSKSRLKQIQLRFLHVNRVQIAHLENSLQIVQLDSVVFLVFT
jgi:hypothetical protein